MSEEIEILLSDPQQDILESTKQINLFLAGVGSGKTHLGGVIVYNFLQFPQLKGFIAANTYDQLNTSTFTRIAEVLALFGITEYSEKTKQGFYVVNKKPPASFADQGFNFISYQNIMTFWTGQIVFLGSLDNAKAHEGKEFAWALLDETKDSDEADVKEIILARLRQKGLFVKDGELNDREGDPINPLYILTSPAKVPWINEWFKLDDNIADIESVIYSGETYFKKEFDNKFCTISSTYHNQTNLPSNYIENKRFDYSTERFKTLIYANPFSRTGSEYYSSFDRIKNVGKCVYNPDIPLHISFDFNSVPYNSLSIWQIEKREDNYFVLGIDEFALVNPRNSTEEVCEAFLARYGNHKSGLYFYADATGRARTTTSKEYKTQIQIIEGKLRRMLNNTSNRVPVSNPANVIRRDFINRIFENKLPIRVVVDERMKYMIADFTYTMQDMVTGDKDKHYVKDPDTGEKYQKYGHFADNFEYMICECFRKYMS